MIRQYIYEVCQYINDNKFGFSSYSNIISVPYLDAPHKFHSAKISYFSCSTTNVPYKKIKPLRGCIPSAIKCFYQNYMDAKCPFEDEITGVWYNNTIPYFNRKTWLHNLLLITKKGYYIPVKSILVNPDPVYSDNQTEESYGIFLSGAIRMAFCYAGGSHETTTDTLSYLYQLLKDTKITILKDQNARYYFLYSLPYYTWI